MINAQIKNIDENATENAAQFIITRTVEIKKERELAANAGEFA